MKKIWDLYHKYEEIINYLIVGGLTTVISLAVKYGLLFTVMDASDALELQIAVIISWIVAVAFAYFANRIFVFHSQFHLALHFFDEEGANLFFCKARRPIKPIEKMPRE